MLKPKKALTWVGVLEYKIIYVPLSNNLNFWKGWFMTIIIIILILSPVLDSEILFNYTYKIDQMRTYIERKK